MDTFENNNGSGFYSDSSIRTYINEISKIPLLSYEEEKELFSLYRENHDKEIFNRICEANLKLVVSIAFKYYNRIKQHNYNISPLDMIQDGNFGLMYAIDGFTYGDHFSTYATYCIKSFILKSVYNKASMIRIPVNLIEKKIMVEKALNKYISENLDKEPTVDELSEITGLKVSDVKRCLTYNNLVTSLDNNIAEEDDSVLDYVASDLSTEDSAINNYLSDYINEVLEEELDEKRKNIVKLHYGFDNKKEQSFYEISKHYGVTRERIKQLNSNALEKLSSNPKIKKLRKDFF